MLTSIFGNKAGFYGQKFFAHFMVLERVFLLEYSFSSYPRRPIFVVNFIFLWINTLKRSFKFEIYAHTKLFY